MRPLLLLLGLLLLGSASAEAQRSRKGRSAKPKIIIVEPDSVREARLSKSSRRTATGGKRSPTAARVAQRLRGGGTKKKVASAPVKGGNPAAGALKSASSMPKQTKRSPAMIMP